MPGKQPTIQNFIASMGKAKGFARTSKYAVVITPPANLGSLIQQAETSESISLTDENNLLDMRSMASQVGRQLNLHCNSVSLPGHDLQAQDMQHGSAPGRQMVTSHDYQGTIAATFYLDSHLRERHFFEKWQKMAVNTNTHKANYYDDYIGSMEIFQLDGNGEITYGIKATEVYPTTLAGIEYAYANANTIATQAVNFQYRQWYNLTSDTIAGYTASDINLEFDKSRQREKELQRLQQKAKTFADSTSSKARSEVSRLSQLRPPNVDRGPPPPLTSERERRRQERLRPPEVDQQSAGQNAGQREADRQKQLISPTAKAGGDRFSGSRN